MNAFIQLFKSIVEISLFASAMIIIVLLIRSLAKDRINLRIISFLWLLVVIRLCIPGMLESPVHIDELFPELSVAQEVTEIHPTQNLIESCENNNTFASPLHNNESLYPVVESTTNNTIGVEPQGTAFFEKVINLIKSLDLWFVAAIIWVVGCSIILTSAIKERISFELHINRYSHPLTNQRLLNTVAEYKRANHIRRNIKISVCSYVHVPMAIGVLHPHILLPLRLTEELSMEHVGVILLHEICHIKKNDILKSYVYVLAKALHWFNPLIWVSLKWIKNDMEFACDQRVLRFMKTGQEIKYCESLLAATRFIKQRKAPQFAATLFIKRSNLKERIVKMIKPHKQSKPAVAISLVLALIMIVTCFTTACQPTPEELIVQNKVDDELNEAIEQTASPVTEINKNQESVDHITDNYTNDSNTVTVNIDADVTMPKISKIPVAQVNETIIPADKIEQIVNTFYGNSQLYDAVSTKEDIEDTILRMQLILTDDEALLHSSVADVSDSTDLNVLKSMVNERIKKLQESLQDAPDHRPEINGYDSALTQGGLYACVDIGEGHSGYFEANVSDSFGQNINLYAFGGDYSEFYRTLEYQLSTPIDSEFDNAEFQNAKKMAGKMIEDMGIDGVTLGEAYLSADNLRGDEISSDREFYVFCFERAVGEGTVDFNFVSTMNNTNQYDTETYDNVYPYETIQIWIEGDEFRQFTWKAPMDVKKIINDNVALAIDYKKAIDLMKQQVFVQFINVDVERAALFSAYKVDINSIDIELVRIREKDTGSYLVVPAWVFHGKVNAAITQAYIDAMKTEGMEVGQYVSANAFWICGDNIMTINALDGSVIDIEAGY